MDITNKLDIAKFNLKEISDYFGQQLARWIIPDDYTNAKWTMLLGGITNFCWEVDGVVYSEEVREIRRKGEFVLVVADDGTGETAVCIFDANKEVTNREEAEKIFDY